MLRRSQLFVPGIEESKIRKSMSLPADSIIFDLEDSVPDSEKETARRLVARILEELASSKERKELCIRINPLQSVESEKDIVSFAASGRISAFVVPKCEGNLGDLKKRIGNKSLIPIVETARGLLHLEDIVRSPGVVAVAYGAADFANSLRGKTSAYQNSAYVKTAIAVAAAAYGIDPIDCVFFNLKDSEGFRREATEAKNLGYTGKQVVHPSQIDLANEIFAPSADEIARAKKIIEVYERLAESGKGAVSVEGELVDAVHYRWARNLVKDFG